MNGFRNQILLGDCMETMRTIPGGIVQVVVTSPPYFALRSYLPAGHPDKPKEIGSEPTPDAFIRTMVDVFREVRRIMRDDGVLFMNLGDSYDNGTSSKRTEGGAGVARWSKESAIGTNGRVDAGIGAGQIMNIPHRVAEALRQDGWVWRQTVVWAKKSPMPESVSGWRWQRCRAKVAGTGWVNGAHPSVAAPGCGKTRSHAFGTHGGEVASEHATKWLPCPGCDKCRDTGGYVLRRGKGRCTTAHEYIFVMTKGERYFWDGEASKEAAGCATIERNKYKRTRKQNGGGSDESMKLGNVNAYDFGDMIAGETRNPRSYWLLSSEPTKEKHFAAFPSELVRRCLVAGCSAGGCCATCGQPFAPMVESERVATRPGDNHKETIYGKSEANTDAQRHVAISRTLGYRTTCSCPPAAPGRQIVFDPFSGTGTVAQTARQLGHDYLGCELNPAYIAISDKRIQEPPRWFIRQQNANKPKRPKPVIVAPGQLSLFGSLEESA